MNLTGAVEATVQALIEADPQKATKKPDFFARSSAWA